MTDSKRKEELSLSYLHAICAMNGISMEPQAHDDDSVDVILKKVYLRSDNSKYNAQISVQLKSTSSGYIDNAFYFSYPLKKKNYDDLRMPATIKPFLFILILPENETDWVLHNVEELILKKCMYWLDLKELPDCGNVSSVTVNFQKSNYISPETLDTILKNIAEEVCL